MCHFVVPVVLAGAALKRMLLFPSSPAYISSIIVLWVTGVLLLGRGFCSLLCFFGGTEEGFAACLKRPRLRHLDRRWTWMPWAVLVFTLGGSLLALEPVYCWWLCPFKAITEYFPLDTARHALQFAMFGSLFLGLVVVLPFLSGKRTQCSFLCPLGPLHALANRINVFEIRIDRDRCTDCSRCDRTCPTFSLDPASIKAGRTLASCVKCGACVDACPSGAAVWHLKGTPVGTRSETARLLYLYVGWAFAILFGGSILTRSLLSLVQILH